jgi:predicted ester cyclase
MQPQEVAQAFVGAFNAGDWDTVASYLSDDFQFSGPVPEPVGAAEWLGISTVFQVAFPDINYNLRVVSVEGNVVKTTSQIKGTHTGDLDLSMLGMGVIPPTGKSFSLPEESGEATVEGGEVTSIHIHSGEGSGIMGILGQLGLKPPSG